MEMHTVRKVAATVAAVGALALPLVAFGASLDVGINQVGTSIALGTADIRTTVAKVINVAMSLLGIVAVVIILAGGFKWMVAGGAEDKVDEAKKLIFAGIIGLAIILSAYAIAQFVINNLVNATTSTTP